MKAHCDWDAGAGRWALTVGGETLATFESEADARACVAGFNAGKP